MRCFSRLSLTPFLLALIWVQPIGAQDSERPLGAQDSEKINSSLGTAVAVPVDPTSVLRPADGALLPVSVATSIGITL